MKNILGMLVIGGLATAQSDDAALIAKAKSIRSRVIKLDPHNDIE